MHKSSVLLLSLTLLACLPGCWKQKTKSSLSQEEQTIKHVPEVSDKKESIAKF